MFSEVTAKGIHYHQNTILGGGERKKKKAGTSRNFFLEVFFSSFRISITEHFYM